MDWSHKVDLRLPLSSEGLLFESFRITQGDREISFDVTNSCWYVAKPTKKMLDLKKKIEYLLYCYRTALLLSNVHQDHESRFRVLELFRQITDVLDGLPVQPTPYTGNTPWLAKSPKK